MGFLYREPGGESHALRVALVSSSVVFSLLLSGIIFGYSGLLNALVFNAKAFAGRCPEGAILPCTEQRDSLTLMYTIGAATISGCAFIVGVFLDCVGPRVTVCVGSLISLSGLLALAFASQFSDNWFYFGFFALAVGGPCIFNSLTSFGELFGVNSGIVISAQTGAFNASSIVMFALGQAVTSLGVPFRTAMLAYGVVPVVVFFTSLLFYPDKPYTAEAGGDAGGEIVRVWKLRQSLSHDPSSRSSAAGPTTPLLDAPALDEQDKPSPPPPAVPLNLYNVDFGRQINSLVFWSMFFVTGFYVLRVNFFIASVTSQLRFEAGVLQTPAFSDPAAAKAQANAYVSLFNLVLPLGGILSVPLVGYVVTYLGLGPSFIAIAFFNTIFSVLNCLNWIPLPYQLIGFAAFTVSRAFIFGAMAAYIGRLFGFHNFGKLYGLARLSGSVATVLNVPLSALAETTCHGNYRAVNIGFLVTEVLTFAFPIYLTKYVFSGFFLRPGYWQPLPAGNSEGVQEAPPPPAAAEDSTAV